jgi:nucleotide-binding universal stress UspA family protein
MYKTVIWATDGSEGSDLALDEALRIVEFTGAHLVAVHCDQRLRGRSAGLAVLADEDDRRTKIRRQIAELFGSGVDVELVLHRTHSDAAAVIGTIAEEFDADLIVCGTRGLGPLAGLALGSVAQGLLHVAPCPVLAVREARKSRIHSYTPIGTVV